MVCGMAALMVENWVGELAVLSVGLLVEWRVEWWDFLMVAMSVERKAVGMAETTVESMGAMKVAKLVAMMVV